MDKSLLYRALFVLKSLVNEQLYINKGLFCRKIMKLVLQQYSYLAFFAHRAQRKSKMEREFSKTVVSMSVASQFLSAAML